MIKKLLLIATLLLTAAGTSASTIPLQLIFTEKLIVVPYTNSLGEARAEFSYRLDAGVSGFGGTEISGWLTVDVSQSVQPGDFTNDIQMDFALLDSNDFTRFAFWEPGLTLDGISLYASDEALMNGQAEFHRGEFPNEVVTGNLSFSGAGDFDTSTGQPFICIECGLDIYFNFLYMDYTTGSLQLNLNDARTGILFGQDYFYGNSPYGWNLNLWAQPVPLPAAWLLMISGIFALKLRQRR